MENYAQLESCAAGYRCWLESATDLPYLKAVDDGLSGVEGMMSSGQIMTPPPLIEETAA